MEEKKILESEKKQNKVKKFFKRIFHRKLNQDQLNKYTVSEPVF